MQANEWIKENGWDEAKNLVAASGWRNTPFLIKIKRLVKSYELVESYGGLEEAKFHESEELEWGRVVWNTKLIQAIADVESCS